MAGTFGVARFFYTKLMACGYHGWCGKAEFIVAFCASFSGVEHSGALGPLAVMGFEALAAFETSVRV